MKLAEGVKDWQTKWMIPENRVVVDVTFTDKAQAVAFADEMQWRFSGRETE